MDENTIIKMIDESKLRDQDVSPSRPLKSSVKSKPKENDISSDVNIKQITPFIESPQ